LKTLQKEALKDFDYTKKRDISIITCNLQSEELKPIIFFTFVNITKAQLPSVMMEYFPNDRLIKQHNISLFQVLLEHRKDELKKYDEIREFILGLEEDYDRRLACNYLGQPYKDYWSIKIPPRYLKILYTEILTYKELIEDINMVFEGYFTVCFQDEGSWKFVEKAINF
jgi:hypothetical protein